VAGEKGSQTSSPGASLRWLLVEIHILLAKINILGLIDYLLKLGNSFQPNVLMSNFSGKFLKIGGGPQFF
jgi:hypothetical protein